MVSRRIKDPHTGEFAAGPKKVIVVTAELHREILLLTFTQFRNFSAGWSEGGTAGRTIDILLGIT